MESISGSASNHPGYLSFAIYLAVEKEMKLYPTVIKLYFKYYRH
jgi:hypothetical protein